MPKKYQPKYIKEMLRYFDRPPYEERREGEKPPQRTPNPLPTFVGFARAIGVSLRTLEEWRQKDPRFAEAWEDALAIQEDIFLTNALLGLYNASFSRSFAQTRTGDLSPEESLQELSTEALEALLGK